MEALAAKDGTKGRDQSGKEQTGKEKGTVTCSHGGNKSTEVEILKRNDEFVFQCKTGEILQDGQPSSTAGYNAGGRLHARIPVKFFRREEEAPYPDPDVMARQDVWSLTRNYIFRKHAAPRTKLHVPNDDFRYL